MKSTITLIFICIISFTAMFTVDYGDPVDTEKDMMAYLEKYEAAFPKVHMHPEKAEPVAEPTYTNDDYLWLAKNIYFEARNQTEEGMIAVGFATLNRVKSNAYPDTIKEVVTQSYRDSTGFPIRNKCQFSWYCDGKSDKVDKSHPWELQAWEDAQQIAAKIISRQLKNPIGDATMYHADSVSPYWKDSYQLVVVIDQHSFYQ